MAVGTSFLPSIHFRHPFFDPDSKLAENVSGRLAVQRQTGLEILVTIDCAERSECVQILENLWKRIVRTGEAFHQRSNVVRLREGRSGVRQKRLKHLLCSLLTMETIYLVGYRFYVQYRIKERFVLSGFPQEQ